MGLYKKWGKVTLALCFIMACTFPAYGTKTDIKDAREKASALEAEKKRVENTLKELEGLKQDAAAYVRRLDQNLEALGGELSELNFNISVKEAEIGEIGQKLEAARETESNQYASMKLRIKYMYEKGETSFLDLLFQSEDMAQLLNRAEYIAKITEYDKKMMDRYAATREQIAETEKQLEEEHIQLLELKERTEAKHTAAEQLLNEKSNELQNYGTQIAGAEGQISEYERDIEAQEAQIKQIEAEIKRKEEEARKAAEAAGKKYNTASIGNIKFVWPCPSSSRVTSSFGGRSSPTEGASSNHQGIDIGAATGANIVAAAGGEVIISTYSYSAGNYIMIHHGGGVYSVYMHCSQLLASAGQQVSQGEVIAKVGSTGVSTGPHLHFGIRVNGSYVNPTNYASP